ncbi:MAG: hypothetical protein ACE5GC_01160 [Acidimicrobiia bacterium]
MSTASASAPLRLVLLVVALFIAAAGCSADDASGGIEFLDGVIAETVPEDFPIPPQSVVGSTLVNRNVDPVFTEMTVRMPATVPVVALYFTTNLPAREYVISFSEAQPTGHVIEFSREALEAEIILRDEGNDITTALIRFNPPQD